MLEINVTLAFENNIQLVSAYHTCIFCFDLLVDYLLETALQMLLPSAGFVYLSSVPYRSRARAGIFFSVIISSQ